ncbi:MAG: DUF3576 domain-containing protein [Pseudomonadota bacterium]|nr:DUF3576 domain-containing protein [Pseudomonadota bacterium]MDE3036981.1 DUF3576 domain-containing protein [Pseudomonadota bacterium]
MIHMIRNILLMCGLVALLSACSGGSGDTTTVPQDQILARQERNGSLTGEEGGFTLLGGGHKTEEGTGGGGIGVNGYLWRATLDTLSFMPLVSADPFGGVVITDWYEDPKAPGERFKVNALILDKTLRADGIKITVFKQKMQNGAWRDEKIDAALEHSLEDAVLTRARQIKVAQLGK